MTTSRREGKDLIIFATADDHKVPSTVVLPEPEPQPGLILPNGEINWNCPCLGGMATGPCGIEFREAFSCFHNSEADPKGSDCLDAFKEMQLCMAEYPQLYSKYNDDDNADIEINLDSSEKALISETSKDQSVEKEKPVEKKSSVATEPRKASSPSVSDKLNKEVQSVNA